MGKVIKGNIAKRNKGGKELLVDVLFPVSVGNSGTWNAYFVGKATERNPVCEPYGCQLFTHDL